MKQEFTPLSVEKLQMISPGDVIERMLAFSIPIYLIVQSVTDDIIDAGWTFDRKTGIEIDEDIPVPVSYIRNAWTREEAERLEIGKK